MAMLAAKVAWLAVDPSPMLFLGDSASYLETARSGWIPPDRSFVYGFLLRPLAVWTGSLFPVVAVQALGNVAGGLVLAWLLIRHLRISTGVTFTIAGLWVAVEPLAVLFERYILTESFALLALAGFVAYALQYLETHRLRWLVLANIASTLLVAFRTVYVPVSIAMALLLPLIALVGAPRSVASPDARGMRAQWLALGLSLLSVLTFHQIYKIAYGQLAARPPSYQNADGLFLLAAWAPLVIARDFPDPALGREVLGGVTCRLDDRHARELARWQDGCLVDLLIKRVGNDSKANGIARAAARRALVRDPLGVVRLALANWTDYLSPGELNAAAHFDRGVTPIPAHLSALLREQFAVVDADRLPDAVTPSNRWFFASIGWCSLLACAPLLAFAALAVAPGNIRRPLLFVTFLILLLLAATMVGSVRVAPRFLHPLGWLVAIPLAVLLARAARGADSIRRCLLQGVVRRRMRGDPLPSLASKNTGPSFRRSGHQLVPRRARPPATARAVVLVMNERGTVGGRARD